MKKTMYLSLGILLMSINLPALAMDMAAMMKQEMKKEAVRTCNEQAFLSCLGTKTKKCLSAFNKAMSACDSLFPKGNAAMGDPNGFMAHGKCMDSNITKNLGISLDKLNACDSGGSGDPVAGMPPMPGGMPPMSGGMPPMSGGMPPTMGNEQGLAMMTQMLQQHAKARGTKGVTLPIYKKATLISHFSSEEGAQMYQGAGIKPLPALSLASPDSVDQIAKFYRKKLKGFREHHPNGETLFIKGGPKKIDMLRHAKLLLTLPHVAISNAQPVPGLPTDTRSQITIFYKK